MGLRLIDEDEALTHEGDGFKIFYRRLPNKRRANIVDACTNRAGTTNFTKASTQMLEYSVQGWEGVYVFENGKRKDIPFEKSKIDLIPDAVQAEMVELIGENADREDENLGNSPSTSGNSSTTKD